MTERSDLLERLQDLRGLSTKKKYQLAKPEQEEVLTVLSALCTTDAEGYRTTVEALTDFPSDLGAALLAEAWPTLMETKLPVTRDLRGAKFNTDLGKRLRISLAQRLLSKDPDSALRVLLDVCQEMKPAKNPIPTTKDLGLLRTALIEPAGQSLGSLPMANAMASELALLTSYILAATFVHKKSQKPLPAQTQLAVMRWANGYPKLGQIPPDVAGAIVQAVRTWDNDFRAILAKEIDTLQVTFREMLAPICRPETTPDAPLPTQEPPKSTPLVDTPSLRPSPAPAQYDALYEIGRLGKYVQSLEGQLRQSRQSLQTAERDWQQTRNELGTVRREKEDARRQASVEHDSAARLAGEKSGLQKEVEALRSEIEKLREQLRAAESRHEQAVASHDEQLDTLSERIAREGEHRVDAFRNKLGAKVQTYADGFVGASDREMTVDLGAALRGQMRQLLRLLKAEGIKIEGGL